MASKKSGNLTSAKDRSSTNSTVSQKQSAPRVTEVPVVIDEIEITVADEEITLTSHESDAEPASIVEDAVSAPVAAIPSIAEPVIAKREIDWQKVRTAIHTAGWDTTLHNGDFDRVWQIAKEKGSAGVAGISWLGSRAKYAKLVEDMTK
jgi:hypothetical protein